MDLNITGKGELRLVVTDAGDGKSHDHADWADPKIFCDAPATSRYPGSLDPSLDGDGRVIVPFSDAGQPTTSVANAIAVRPDGRVLAVGLAYQKSAQRVGEAKTVLVQVRPDGSFDPTFKGGGRTIVNLSPTSSNNPSGAETPYTLALLPDGKFVVGGSFEGRFADSTFLQPFSFLARFGGDGTLDTTFGNGGKVEMSSLENALVTQILVQPDGKLVVNTGRDVRRYNANGTLDATFGNGGSLEARDQYHAGGLSIALQSSGKLLIATNGVLKRYTSSGQLDPSFGTGGQVTYAEWRSEGPDGFGVGPVVVLPGDAILVSLEASTVAGGTDSPPFYKRREMLVQQMPDGAIDRRFGQQGRVVYENSLGGYGLSRLQRQPDGKFLSYPNRFNTDGSRDLSFQISSAVTFLSNSSSVAFQPDGKIVLASAVSQGDSPNTTFFSVTRLLP